MTKFIATKLGTTTSSLLALLACTSACGMEDLSGEPSDLDEVGETSQEVYNPTSPPAPVATDACDESSYAGTSWTTASSQHFVANYLAGTAAESDIATILARRESAYTNIRAALGITAEPTITLYLSPNRIAAQDKGRALGNAFPGLDRIEVVYTGAANSFEVARAGNLLTRTLEYYIDTANPRRLPILSAGLGEVLDQSSRNLHDAYAFQIYAGVETRTRINNFDSADLNGRNVGKAASLVQFLVDRYGMPTFVEIFKRTKIASVSGCSMKSAEFGCVNSAASLEAALGGAIAAVTGEPWATVASDWKAAVDARLDRVNPTLGTADKAAITNLVNLMDQAIETGDAAVYRSTMEGFYCEWGGEAQRTDIAARVLDSYAGSRTTVTRIFPSAIGNFPTARVQVRRFDQRGIPAHLTLTAEKFPVGWRITYGPDWW